LLAPLKLEIDDEQVGEANHFPLHRFPFGGGRSGSRFREK
jgi:hypothetical protein